jgi:protein TorT
VRSSTLNWLLPLSLLLFTATVHPSDAWYPVEVDVWEPPYNTERSRRTQTYFALPQAEKPWRICVSIPHLKDDYWTAVNFGLIDEARRLGVGMQLFEAGGYANLETQRKQIAECMDRGADGLIISAISADGLNDLVERYAAEGKAVVDLINGLASPAITARAAVDFWDMGNQTAQYLRRLHADAAEPVGVAWFPGPHGAAWVAAGDAGFRAGTRGSPIRIVTAAKGDTGRTAQGKLVEEAIDAHPDLHYIVGTAVTAEAAVPILRRRGLAGQVKVLAYYYSPGVHRGVSRGRMLAAPTDRQALLARIALDQTVRALEGRELLQHVAPQVIVIDRSNIRGFDSSTTLPPRGFRPVFSINEW